MRDFFLFSPEDGNKSCEFNSYRLTWKEKYHATRYICRFLRLLSRHQNYEKSRHGLIHVSGSFDFFFIGINNASASSNLRVMRRRRSSTEGHPRRFGERRTNLGQGIRRELWGRSLALCRKAGRDRGWRKGLTSACEPSAGQRLCGWV